MSNSTPPDFTPISDLGEFGLIDRMDAILGHSTDEDIVEGISDDAAVYRIGDGRVHVVTTDALIEAVHFDRMLTPLEHLGFKALSVNVSDIAAMNALPRFATVALGLPGNMTVEMVEAIYRGLKRAADLYGLSIIGGDTTAANRLVLSITVIGEAEEHAIAYRSNAKVGDALCVTGDLGASYAGLRVLLKQRDELQKQGEAFKPDLDRYRYIIGRQLAPSARMETIRDWAERGVRPHAMIDISDGLASEVHHICRLSGCGAVLHAGSVPIDLETRLAADDMEEDVDSFALFGGEDYELLFTMPHAVLDKLKPESFAVIGEITDAAEGVRVRTPDGTDISLEARGFQHFGYDPAAGL